MIKLNPDQYFVYCWRYENTNEAMEAAKEAYTRISVERTEEEA